MEKSRAVIVAFIIIVIGAVLVWWTISSPDHRKPEQNDKIETEAVRKVVTNFGEALKNVSLLSSMASEQIQQYYAPFVTKGLLAKWTKNPKKAPGRLTSSPWPEQIEVMSIKREGSESFRLLAQIILMTSKQEASKANDYAGSRPIQLIVKKTEGTWQIASFSYD